MAGQNFKFNFCYNFTYTLHLDTSNERIYLVISKLKSITTTTLNQQLFYINNHSPSTAGSKPTHFPNLVNLATLLLSFYILSGNNLVLSDPPLLFQCLYFLHYIHYPCYFYMYVHIRILSPALI